MINVQKQFYLNPGKGHECITLPTNQDDMTLNTKDKKYLKISNHLSEYYTQEDKEQVLSNLGILSRLEGLKHLIDVKILELGGIPFDSEPVENSDNILTSGTIYNLFYLKTQIDEKIQELLRIFSVDDSLNENSTHAVQNKVINREIGRINTALNILYQEIQSKEISINNLFSKYDNLNEKLNNYYNELKEQFNNYYDTETIDEKVNLIYNKINQLREDVPNIVGQNLYIPISSEEIANIISENFLNND